MGQFELWRACCRCPSTAGKVSYLDPICLGSPRKLTSTTTTFCIGLSGGWTRIAAIHPMDAEPTRILGPSVSVWFYESCRTSSTPHLAQMVPSQFSNRLLPEIFRGISCQHNSLAKPFRQRLPLHFPTCWRKYPLENGEVLVVVTIISYKIYIWKFSPLNY